jgi:hypothetical protein
VPCFLARPLAEAKESSGSDGQGRWNDTGLSGRKSVLRGLVLGVLHEESTGCNVARIPMAALTASQLPRNHRRGRKSGHSTIRCLAIARVQVLDSSLVDKIISIYMRAIGVVSGLGLMRCSIKPLLPEPETQEQILAEFRDLASDPTLRPELRAEFGQLAVLIEQLPRYEELWDRTAAELGIHQLFQTLPNEEIAKY